MKAEEIHQRYDKLEALPKPVIVDEHCQSSAIHKALREMRSVPAFDISLLRVKGDDEPTESSRIACQDNYNGSLLRMKFRETIWPKPPSAKLSFSRP